jgi:hypothetical protein
MSTAWSDFRVEAVAERIERVSLDRPCALLRDMELRGDLGELLRRPAEPEVPFDKTPLSAR